MEMVYPNWRLHLLMLAMFAFSLLISTGVSMAILAWLSTHSVNERYTQDLSACSCHFLEKHDSDSALSCRLAEL